jgi:hypothetical protein
LPEHYADAPIRHFRDAETLASGQAFDNAAHLLGFAAECAIKLCVEELRPTSQAPHLHLPELVEKAKRLVHGRKKHPMLTVLSLPAFMSGWKVESRYSSDGTITQQMYETWRIDATRALGAAQLRGRR